MTPLALDSADGRPPRARKFGRLARLPLAAKLGLAFVGLVAFALIVNGAIEAWLGYDQAREAALHVQRDQTEAAADDVEAFLGGIETQLRWTTGAEWGYAKPEQQRYDFIRLLRETPAITSLAYIDGHGKEQLAVSRLEPDAIASGKDFSGDPRFLRAVADKVWFGPVEFRRGSEPYMTIAVAHVGKTPGVTAADVNLKLVWDVISAIHVGDKGFAYVVDDKGRLIADPDLSLVLRDTDLSALPQVKAALARLGSAAAGPAPIAGAAEVAKGRDGGDVLTAYAIAEKPRWIVFVQQPLAEALAPVTQALLRTLGLLGLGLLLAIVSGAALARRMTAPIRALQKGAERLGAGDLGQRIDVRTGDEIEALAGSFNAMAGRLKESYETLEARVETRTEELNEALRRQTATSDVLRAIAASPSDIAPALATLSETVCRLCQAHDAVIMLRQGEWLRIVAHHGPIPLPADWGGPVSRDWPPGRAVIERRPVAALDLEAEAAEFPFAVARAVEARAEDGEGAMGLAWRSVLAMPLLREGEAIGAIALRRREVSAFSDSQAALLATFADQAAIAAENARLFAETQEALDRQTATAEILRVIAGSPADAAPVFEAILESCQRLLGLESVAVYLVKGDRVRGVAQRGWASGDWGRDAQPLAGSSTGLAIAERRAIHIPDLADQPNFPEEKRTTVVAGGGLTVLYAPMLLEDVGVGSIVVARRPARPFTDKEIALAQSFADQAAIAIQNAGLFDEVQARTRDLEESLAQQTATADVLKVISRSTFDLQTVLDTLAASAVSLCGARSGVIYLRAGGGFELRAATEDTEEPELFRRLREAPLKPGRGTVGGRVLLTGEVQNIADFHADPESDPERRTINRALLGVPLKRGDDLVGAIVVSRAEPGLFTERQIQIVKTFADQAVIAIENARLFNETQEALERERAAAEILGAVSQSVADAQPVFEQIAEACARLFGTANAAIWRIDDDGMVRIAAGRGELVARGRNDVTPLDKSYTGRVARTRQVLHIPDQSAEPDLSEAMRERLRLAGGVSLFYAPIIAENRVIGSLGAMRSPPRPFSDKELALAKTFADQAAIAIQNAKLFRETNEALQHQVATSEVLQAIGRSMADAQPVFERIVETLANLFPHQSIGIFLAPGDGFVHLAARRGPRLDEIAALYPRPIEGSAVPTVLETARQTVYPDLLNGEGVPMSLRRAAEAAGNCANVVTPMVWKGRGVGMITVAREVGERFGERELSLLRTFADQAVIAIENARLFAEVQAKTRDLEESLAQQTATAEVLEVIASSPTDLTPVFDAIAARAAALCEAENSGVFRLQDGLVHVAGQSNISPEQAALARAAFPAPLSRSTASGRAMLTRAVVHIPDIAADPEYGARAMVDAGFRSALSAPMLLNGEPVGAINVTRTTPRPFSQRQIDLLQTFAAQAVIAIENARLFNETQESLAQQTATADVLKVISRSAFDLQPVLDTLIESAVRLLGGARGAICLRDGDVYPFRATFGETPEFAAWLREHPAVAGRGSIVGRVALSGRVEQIPDVREDAEHLVPAEDYRSLVGVPLVRDGETAGALVVVRVAAGAFSDRQIDLLQTFAAQAVIAIENVRLFNETQESLAQQTATAEVLQTISRSVFDLETVLRTLIDTAVRLCRGSRGTIFIRNGDRIEARGFHSNVPEGLRDYVLAHPPPYDSPDAIATAVREGRIIHTPDLASNPSLIPAGAREHAAFGAVLCVPLMREGEAIGCFAMPRDTAVAFTAREIELVKTFADQAVIAIENARLFGEVQAKTRDLEESLAQQTATAEVLKVISRSAFNLAAIFQTLVATAVDLCKASSGTLCVRDGDVFRYQGMAGPDSSPDLQRYLEAHPIVAPDRRTIAGRTILSKTIENIPDITADPAYAAPLGTHGNPARALLGVPLIGKDRVEGAFVLTRKEPGEFPARQIEILQTFADQAVIAIENARLFEAVQERTRELARSLEDLRRAQDRLVQSEKLASLGQLTAGIAHEIKNPLNFVNNFSALSRELLDELGDIVRDAPLEAAVREEALELVEMTQGNLAKVVSHGQRADSIVKNMLLHARQGSAERARVGVNSLVEEALNLAYHGARAERPGFNVTVARDLDPDAGEAELYPQEITRVLLNLISNGFYATMKRKQGGEQDHEPTLAASTRDLGDGVEIVIRDNGTGIPADVMAKLFNPFFTTKPAGEGTGLGLSLSHDIVVRQHGGSIDVESEPGSTRFIVRLPRADRGAGSGR